MGVTDFKKKIFVLRVNKYLAPDQVVLITDVYQKYKFLVNMGMIEKNKYFEKEFEEIQECKYN